MLLEIFVPSLLYSSYGLLKLKQAKDTLKRGEKLEDGTELLETKESVIFNKVSNDRLVYTPPMYMNMNPGTVGMGIPIGGGSEMEEKTLITSFKNGSAEPLLKWSICDFNKEALGPLEKRYFLNTTEQIQEFCKENSINSQLFPGYVPLKVRQMMVPAGASTWYANYYRIAGTSQTAVLDEIIHRRFRWNNPLFAATTVAVATGILVAVDYREQWWRIKNLFT